MKVFISWSGGVSHKVAKELRDWLPSVIQSITPYVSSEDIDKGARWSSDIAGELDDSKYGVICVTPDNMDAPWLNFEAGALGRSVDKSKVSPFLFRVKPSELKGPVLQFQATIHEKNDVFKLLKSINDACGEAGIEEKRLVKSFEVWWPKLDEALEAIKAPATKKAQTPTSSLEAEKDVSRILEEVLEISRTNQRLLRDPETILPIGYVQHVFKQLDTSLSSNHLLKAGRAFDHEGEGAIDREALRDVVDRYKELLNFLKLGYEAGRGRRCSVSRITEFHL